MQTFSLRLEKEIINYYKVMSIQENKTISELIRDSIRRDLSPELYDSLVSGNSKVIYKSNLNDY